MIAFFIREWTGYSEAVYISDSEDFVCMTKSDDCQMLYGDGSIRVVAAAVARSRGVKIEATTLPLPMVTTRTDGMENNYLS